MSETSKKNSPSRRQFLSSVGAMLGITVLAAFTVLTPTSLIEASGTQKENSMNTLVRTTTDVEIRPFTINIPEAALDDLRQRISATRWTSEELVADRSQGVQLATLRELARYWATEYDWRKVEAKLNALPMFVTE